MRARTALAAAALFGAVLLGRLLARADEKADAPKPPAGFPSADEAQRLYDDADLNRAGKAGPGSLYRLGLRDGTGAYLDGGKTYRLTVPQPVPAKLFWSVTVYDAETRSQVQTDQGKAALRSLFELKDRADAKTADLYFGTKAPPGEEGQWIRTTPGKGWFVYFRICGPGEAAFDGSWRPGDFEEVK